MRRHLRAWTMVVLFSLVGSGCYGPFTAVRKLYGFNGTMGGKFFQTVTFWVFAILQVYTLFTLGDIFIFNLIEFWSGKDVLANGEVPEQERVVAIRGREVRMTRLDGNDGVRIAVRDEAGTVEVFELRATANGATIQEGAGRVLVETTATPDGTTIVRDATGEVVDRRSRAEWEAITHALVARDVVALQTFVLPSPVLACR